MRALLLLSVAVTCKGQNNDRVVFGSSSETVGGCTTVSGPAVGRACQLPFAWGGKVREGCITDGDPEGKYWCSTKVDGEGNHVTNGEHWAHCSPQCPGVQPVISSAFTVAAGLCVTPAGAEGTCKIPSTCIGATIDYIENNECGLPSGEEGVCCLPISVDNIINIIDSPH